MKVLRIAVLLLLVALAHSQDENAEDIFDSPVEESRDVIAPSDFNDDGAVNEGSDAFEMSTAIVEPVTQPQEVNGEGIDPLVLTTKEGEQTPSTEDIPPSTEVSSEMKEAQTEEELQTTTSPTKKPAKTTLPLPEEAIAEDPFAITESPTESQEPTHSAEVSHESTASSKFSHTPTLEHRVLKEKEDVSSIAEEITKSSREHSDAVEDSELTSPSPADRPVNTEQDESAGLPFDQDKLSTLFEQDGSINPTHLLNIGSSSTDTPAFPIVRLPEEGEISTEKSTEVSTEKSVEKSTEKTEEVTPEPEPIVKSSEIVASPDEEEEKDETSSEFPDITKNTEPGTSTSTEKMEETTAEDVTTVKELPTSIEEKKEIVVEQPTSSTEIIKEEASSTTTVAALQETSTEEKTSSTEENVRQPVIDIKPTEDTTTMITDKTELSSSTSSETTKIHEEETEKPAVISLPKSVNFTVKITSIEYMTAFSDINSGEFKKLRNQIQTELSALLHTVLGDELVGFEIDKVDEGVLIKGRILTKREIEDFEELASRIESLVSTNGASIGGNTVDPKTITVNGVPSRAYLERVQSSYSSSPSAFLVGSIISICVLIILVVAFIIIARRHSAENDDSPFSSIFLNNRRTNGTMKLRKDDMCRMENGGKHAAAYSNPAVAVNLKSYGSGTMHPLESPQAMVIMGSHIMPQSSHHHHPSHDYHTYHF